MSIGNNGRLCRGGLPFRKRVRANDVSVFCTVLVPCFLFAGCAPLTEKQQFERDHRLNLAKEEFLLKEESCRQAGGAMRTQATPLAGLGKHDYKTARCVRL